LKRFFDSDISLLPQSQFKSLRCTWPPSIIRGNYYRIFHRVDN